MRPRATPLSLSDATLVDLTHPLSPDSLYWPNGSAFEYERELWGEREDGKWYAMGKYATPEHLGTHLDAPIHFAPDVWTNSEIPVERFFGPAVVIDITERAAADPDTLEAPTSGEKSLLIAVAAHLGATRLIDNVVLGRDPRP